MKRFLFLILTLLLMVGCGAPKQLTIEALAELQSEKGTELDWSDFEEYESNDIGFGMCILRYDIDDDRYILIGGPSMEEKPWYVQLCSRHDTHEYIDLLEQELDEFLKQYS